MIRVVAILVTVAVCVGGGASAGLAAFASELSWPLSGGNFADAARLGTAYGAAGALLAVFCLSVVDRRHVWPAAVIAVAATWLITFIASWWNVVSSLG